MSQAYNEIGVVREYWSTVGNYMKNLSYGIEYKAPFAALMAVFTDVLGGHAIVLYGFFTIATIDFILGVTRAVVFQNFDNRMLGKWMVKLTVQLLLAFVIILFVHMLSVTAGVTIVVVNWLFLFYALHDTVSIIDKLETLGFKIPIPIKVIVSLLRRRTLLDITQYLRVPEMREQIEKELAKAHDAEEREVDNKGGGVCGNSS